MTLLHLEVLPPSWKKSKEYLFLFLKKSKHTKVVNAVIIHLKSEQFSCLQLLSITTEL